MRTVRGLIGKLGFTVIGVGAGLILAAGSGVAAVHLTQAAATEHSIAVVQSTSSEDRVHPEDSNTSGTDDVAGTSKSDDAAQPEPESADATDDSSSKPAAADNSGDRSSQSTGSSSRSPEPGDDHGPDGGK